MPLPYQGRPGQRDLASPTLIPNFYLAYAKPNVAGAVGGTINNESPAQVNNENPRAAATATATIGGTITNGDTVTLTLTQAQLPGGSISGTYAVVTGDSVGTVAEGLAAAFNTALASAGLLGLIEASAVEAVVTMNWFGPAGNQAVLSKSTSGGATETITIAPVGGALSGGTGPLFCSNNFNFSFSGGTTQAFYYGKPYFLSGPQVAALVAADAPMV